jgi:hypothetical protein
MNSSSIRRVIPKLMAKRRPCMIWGAPGIGKSDVAASIAADLKVELRDVRLPLLDPTDIKGFPMPDVARSMMRWLPADFLPTKGKGILFLDEINGAMQAVQAATYQLILNGAIGEYKLPVGWYCMAAGNRSTDRSVVHTMPAALANRFIHLDMSVSAKDWDVWAAEHGIHTDIRAYMRMQPDMLHVFDTKTTPRAFPSPRSWAFVNDIYQDHATADEEMEVITGTVGQEAAAGFIGFVKLKGDVPSAAEVIADPKGTKLPVNASGRWAISTELDSKANKTNIDKIMTYMYRLDTEFQVVFWRGVVTRDDTLTGTKTYTDWLIKNQNVLQ